MPAATTYLPLPDTVGSGYAIDINSLGTIIGYGGPIAGGSSEVLRWNKSGTTWTVEAPIPAPGNEAIPQAISEAAQARFVGKAKFLSGGPYRAFFSEPGSVNVDYNLGTLGGSSSESWDVHDSHGVVGSAKNSADKLRAFFLPIGQVGPNALNSSHELPRLAGTVGTSYNSEAYSVNRFGEVVGRVQNDSGLYRAFYYSPGAATLTDLTTAVLGDGQTPAQKGWVLQSAVAINDGGILVGRGTKNGFSRGWVIYPQPQE